MTKQQHPITPPPELVEQWLVHAPNPLDRFGHVATQAAQWGADQELEACCEYLTRCAAWEPEDVTEFCDNRRPKPPSLAEEALQALNEAFEMADDSPPEGICADQANVIRRALERLQELENND